MDDPNYSSGGTSGEGDMFYGIIAIIVFSVLFFCCCRRERTTANLETRPTTAFIFTGGGGGWASSDNAEEGGTVEPTLEERRAEIEDKLITRKVVAPASESTEDLSGRSSDSSKSSTRLAKLTHDLTHSERAYSSYFAAILPRRGSSRGNLAFSEPIRSASVANLSTAREDEDEEASDKQDEKEEEPVVDVPLAAAPQDVAEDIKVDNHAPTSSQRPPQPRRKCNIVARTIATTLRSVGSNDDQNSCEICLMAYEVGEDVCWSPNEDCIHAFHKECIMDWLLTQQARDGYANSGNNCPCCRRDYLLDNRTESKRNQDENV